MMRPSPPSSPPRVSFLPSTSSPSAEALPSEITLVSSATVQDPLSEAQLAVKYGKGFKMLKKLGYQPGRGVGRDQTGISAPLFVFQRGQREGVADEREMRKEAKAKLRERENKRPAGKTNHYIYFMAQIK